MDDYLVRILAKDAGVRAFGCLMTNIVNQITSRHQTAPTATVALGRAVVAGALLGGLLKMRQRLAIKFEGDGPLGRIIVEADANGQVRGYVAAPDVDLPLQDGAYDVGGALGYDGVLTVVKDLRLKELAEGVVPLTTGHIDHDLTFYLNHSEQIPSVVKVEVELDENGRVAAAGGLLIQAIPPYKEETVFALADRLEEMPPMGELLQAGRTPEELLDDIFQGVPYAWLGQQPLFFICSCSRERSRRALLNLGREDLEDLLATEGEAVIDCHFCRAQYTFGREEMEEMLAEMP
jgi:molecular chaperone Hsp33